MLATRSLLFNALFYLNLVILMIIGLPTMLFGRKAVFALARLWGAISVWLLEKICGLRLEYRGVENIPPGAVLIAAKHQSFLETFALLKYAPDFAIILKRQLTYVPLFGLYLIVSKQIAIDRARGRQALQQIAAAAKPVFAARRQVFIYPEGTRRLPGAPPKYKQGVTALYMETGVACLPVAVNTGLTEVILRALGKLAASVAGVHFLAHASVQMHRASRMSLRSSGLPLLREPATICRMAQETEVLHPLAVRTIRYCTGEQWLAHLEKRRSLLRDGRAEAVRFAASCFELARWKNRTGHGAVIASLARAA